MSSSKDLLDLVVAAVSVPDATDAQSRVYRPGDWPTQDSQYPILKLRVIRESKQSLGRGGPPEFLVLTVVRVTSEVSAPVQVNDAGAAEAERRLWLMHRQIEVAVINSYPLTSSIQQFASIESQLSYNSDAETHLAGIQTDITLEHYQGPEDFAPIVADDMTEVEIEDPNHPPFGVTVELPE